jgi:23S rRNA (pseudouridine1915-N3)-methyltransferase
MRLSIQSITLRAKSAAALQLADDYDSRLRPFVQLESERFSTEAKFLEKAMSAGRTRPTLILLDSRGKLFSSKEFAAWVGRQRDSGVQHLIFAIGPADGWSAPARERADLLLSFGPMTFPHELARVMLAEQLYRAFTILAGHPYHSGH